MELETKATRITIGPRERACINCKQYRQCYRENPVPGEVYKAMIPVSFGYCALHEDRRGALRQPCKNFETKETPPRLVTTGAGAGKTN